MAAPLSPAVAGAAHTHPAHCTHHRPELSCGWLLLLALVCLLSPKNITSIFKLLVSRGKRFITLCTKQYFYKYSLRARVRANQPQVSLRSFWWKIGAFNKNLRKCVVPRYLHKNVWQLRATAKFGFARIENKLRNKFWRKQTFRSFISISNFFSTAYILAVGWLYT